MPTDSLAHNAEVMEEARRIGLDKLKEAQIELGAKVRELMAERGFALVVVPEFAAPSVVVSYTNDQDIRVGAAFKQVGVQISGGVPWHCGEPADFSRFRLGLFGLDELGDVDGTVIRLRDALDSVAAHQFLKHGAHVRGGCGRLVRTWVRGLIPGLLAPSGSWRIQGGEVFGLRLINALAQNICVAGMAGYLGNQMLPHPQAGDRVGYAGPLPVAQRYTDVEVE